MATVPKAPPLDDQGRPYFLWSEDIDELGFRKILRGEVGADLRARYMARLLREARVAEVWYYLTPQEIADSWSELAPRLGRLTEFWRSLLESWNASGRISWKP